MKWLETLLNQSDKLQGRAEGKQELFKQRQDMLQGTSVRRR